MCGIIQSVLLSLLLTACASQARISHPPPELILPQTLHIKSDTGQDWLLVIQDEDGHLRFSLFDPLGVPLARQQLINRKWRNDGLLPPNREAQELFNTLLLALWQSKASTIPAMTLHPHHGRSYQFTPVQTP